MENVQINKKCWGGAARGYTSGYVLGWGWGGVHVAEGQPDGGCQHGHGRILRADVVGPGVSRGIHPPFDSRGWGGAHRDCRSPRAPGTCTG